MDIQVELDAITVIASNLHPVERDDAVRILRDLTMQLHRALAAADADG